MVEQLGKIPGHVECKNKFYMKYIYVKKITT